MLKGLFVLGLVAVVAALNAPPGTRVCFIYLFFSFFFFFFNFSSLFTQITSLPGYNGPALSMYSGYITVNQTAGRALFYWLVEATNVDPTTAPLVFWYQGGPGCSGLGGLLSEHGPLVPNVQGGLSVNPIAWTQIANVVYLEQPAFVGFSYSNTSSDVNTGDVRATVDNVAFVNGFLAAYPDYVGRTTWFTGESYGGFYVPSLTSAVLSNPNTQIYKQLAGFMVGNPVMFTVAENTITPQFYNYYWHGLVSFSNFQAWQTNNCPSNENSNVCQNIWNVTQTQIGVINQELKRSSSLRRRQGVPIQPSLDPDDLYQDFCTGNGTLDYVATVPINCQPVGQLVATYLNRADVQAAIHAQGPNGGAPLTWTECTSVINYNISGASLVPLYAKFQQQKPGLHVLVYSGDVDIATVPFPTTQEALGELINVTGAQNLVPFQPWFVNGQTAGYYEVYETHTYATVKGAGHEAPEYQPLSAFNLFSRYLNTQTLKDPSQNARNVMPRRPMRQGDVLRMYRRQGKLAK